MKILNIIENILTVLLLLLYIVILPFSIYAICTGDLFVVLPLIVITYGVVGLLYYSRHKTYGDKK